MANTARNPIISKKLQREEDKFNATFKKKTTKTDEEEKAPLSEKSSASFLKTIGTLPKNAPQNAILLNPQTEATAAHAILDIPQIKDSIGRALEEKFGVLDARSSIAKIEDSEVEKSIPIAEETIARNVKSGKTNKYTVEKYPYMLDAFAMMYAAGDAGDKKLANNLYRLAYTEGEVGINSKSYTPKTDFSSLVESAKVSADPDLALEKPELTNSHKEIRKVRYDIDEDASDSEVYANKETSEIKPNSFYEDYLNNKNNKYNKERTFRISDLIDNQFSNIYKSLKDAEKKAIEKIVEQNNVSFEHAKIMHFSTQWGDIPEYKWTNSDIVYWKAVGGDEYINSKKLAFIENYKDVIIDASKKYDIPPLLLAGVAYIEFGGDPMWLDDVAYTARNLYDYLPDFIKPYVPEGQRERLDTASEKTSFGNTSIQVRRALEMLGYDDNDTNRKAVIASLKDPIQNIYMTACHLDELRNVDFKGKSSSELSEDEIKIIASRYNIGPEPATNAILTEYGDRIYNNEEQILKALGLN